MEEKDWVEIKCKAYLVELWRTLRMDILLVNDSCLQNNLNIDERTEANAVHTIFLL